MRPEARAYRRKKFRTVFAFQVTEKMMERWSRGYDLTDDIILENKSHPGEEPELAPAIRHTPQSMSFLSVGCWVAKCAETGETFVQWDHEETPEWDFLTEWEAVPHQIQGGHLAASQQGQNQADS